jgi:hypothetical protein
MNRLAMPVRGARKRLKSGPEASGASKHHEPFGIKGSLAGAGGQGRVRTSGPSAVTATVCSAWAARLPSPLRMVQPSSSMK